MHATNEVDRIINAAEKTVRLLAWIRSHSPASVRLTLEGIEIGIYWSNTTNGTNGIEYHTVNTYAEARNVLGY